MGEIDREVELLRGQLPEAVLAVEERPERGMFWITVRPADIVPAALLMRDHPECDYKLLCDLLGADYPDREKRFDVLYNLYSFSRNRRLFLRVQVGEAEPVPTVSGIWTNAN